MQTVITIFAAAIGSTALWQFFQFLLNRKDKKADKHDDTAENIQSIKKTCAKLERDACRTQMLVMMAHHETDTAEILKLAQHYFGDLNGNWYMTSMFNRWLEKNGIGKPEWFNGER